MRRSVGLLAAVLSIVAVADVAVAEPNPIPPPQYSSRIFVDQSGCVFTRARIAGWDVWVQSLDAERRPLCDREPTLPDSGHGAPREAAQPEART